MDPRVDDVPVLRKVHPSSPLNVTNLAELGALSSMNAASVCCGPALDLARPQQRRCEVGACRSHTTATRMLEMCRRMVQIRQLELAVTSLFRRGQLKDAATTYVGMGAPAVGSAWPCERRMDA